MERRRFLQLATTGCVATGLMPITAMSVETRIVHPARLIMIFLRGGLDGLFAIAPVADPRLAELRPTLARTALEKGMPLGNSGFAAHPAATLFADWYREGQLAFAPCAGTTDRSRSHFQAQDLFELGSGAITGGSGFLGRAAGVIEPNRRSVAFTREVPLCLRGGDSEPEVAPLSGSGLKIPEGNLRNALLAAHRGQASGRALEQAIATEEEIVAAMGMDAQAARGAPGIAGFPRIAETMGRMLRANQRIALSFVDFGGLDTHAGEDGVLTRVLLALTSALQALRQTLGTEEWARTRVVLMSEFGRTARENGTKGTDHGHGGLFLVAGGNVAGGRMLGDFPGLGDNVLHDRRDLPVLADWRDLLAACLRASFDLSEPALNRVFPGRPGRTYSV